MDNGGAAKAKEQTVMERESAALDESLRRLASVIEELESRLVTLRVSQEEPKPVETGDVDTMSSMCMRIRGQRRQVEGFETGVSRLLNELEI